ncbi:hypothetical protein VTN77DRAFT_1599 [Rasamsonia byssochlamydoides]|uniref:uncharacterized protein n=1 Tax=Rasamsonia byssochlamydoides TaxID=89139 RepID=UPI003742D3DE
MEMPHSIMKNSRRTSESSSHPLTSRTKASGSVLPILRSSLPALPPMLDLIQILLALPARFCPFLRWLLWIQQTPTDTVKHHDSPFSRRRMLFQIHRLADIKRSLLVHRRRKYTMIQRAFFYCSVGFLTTPQSLTSDNATNSLSSSINAKQSNSLDEKPLLPQIYLQGQRNTT